MFLQKTYRAHRLAYELTYDTSLGDKFACHTCDNPLCVRPDHIFPGTPKDNFDDAFSKGRSTPQRRRKTMLKLIDPPSPEPPIVIVEAPDETPPESRYTDAIRDALERVENEQCDQDFAQPQPDEDDPTPPRYTREPAADNARHGCAWRGPFGLLRWCEPGYDPNSELLRVSV